MGNAWLAHPAWARIEGFFGSFFRTRTNLLLSYEKAAKRLLFLALHLSACRLDGRPLCRTEALLQRFPWTGD
jgi:hypothetical protein